MNRVVRILPLVILLAFAARPAALAQETGPEDAALREQAMRTLPANAARRLFGAVTTPADGEPVITGEYWKGCFSGGVQLPENGEHWQVMRLSRNRRWGHPALVAFLKRFSGAAAEATGWRGILIGDMSQPRGGPMLTGHASHQIGIDADIWLRPMPEHKLSDHDIEEMFSTSLLRADRKDVDPKVYTPQHLALLRAAAKEPEVARVFVNAGIKKALCRDAGEDRAWLSKIRPAYGHDYHFHIRLACPKGQTACKDQSAPPPGDGCGKALDYWFTPGVLNAKLGGRGSIPLSAMPKACQLLLSAAPAKPERGKSDR
jgi:penicillin-insensitive murein endopeptidase